MTEFAFIAGAVLAWVWVADAPARKQRRFRRQVQEYMEPREGEQWASQVGRIADVLGWMNREKAKKEGREPPVQFNPRRVPWERE